VLALDGDRVIGHAVATTRWLHVGDMAAPHQRLRTAYVDAVATDPAHQHRGVGSSVMRQLTSDIADHDIGCLETEVRGFYEPLGWQLWRGPLAGLRGSEPVPTPDQTGIMVLRLPPTRDLDLDALLTIEADRRIW
jgi:aminoglycoside 2'-N-acetyltransferase I